MYRADAVHEKRIYQWEGSFLGHDYIVLPSNVSHSWELFEWNGGHSIAKWSESPVESWNKHVRSFQSGPAVRSRQLSVKDNIQDIFHRMLIMSHPEIESTPPPPQVAQFVVKWVTQLGRQSTRKCPFCQKNKHELNRCITDRSIVLSICVCSNTYNFCFEGIIQ